MTIEIKIPSPGESVNEVEISSWLVNDGDYVEKDQEIAEIESDKATLPLLAEESGIISIKAETGTSIPVGSVACTIDSHGKPPTAAKKSPEESVRNEEPSKEHRTEKSAGEKEGINEHKPGKTEHSQTPGEVTEKVKISPLAKKLMKEENLNVDDIIRGLRRISREDVSLVAGMKEPEGPPAPKQDKAGREASRKRMSMLRRNLSQRLVAVKNETAMLTTFNEVDMSKVIDIRKNYQSNFVEKHGVKLGFMSFFVRAASEALKLYPNVNSYIDGEDIVTPGYCDIGIAVQTDKGLMVPVIRNTGALGLSDIEKRILELAEKARKNRISIEDMTGGTFTITNGGIFGSLLSTPILNPPQSGILGMHNIVERPVAVNGKVEVRPMMYIALSYDHRIIDGRDSVSFLVSIKEIIEDPAKLLFGGQDPDKILLDL